MKEKIVLDTNIIVSALYNPQSNIAIFFRDVLKGEYTIFLDDLILDEYRNVLSRKKFNFNQEYVSDILSQLIRKSIFFTSEKSKRKFKDEPDRKFYDCAKQTNSTLITGNIKDFPKENFIMSPSDFLH